MNKEDKHIGKQLQGVRKLRLEDGREVEVFFSFNAMIELIDRHGSLKAIFSEFEKGEEMDFNVFLDFLYEGVKTRNKEMTKEELGDNLDFFKLGDYVSNVFGVMKDNLPSDAKDQ